MWDRTRYRNRYWHLRIASGKKCLPQWHLITSQTNAIFSIYLVRIVLLQISNIALNGRNKLRERVLCWILIICLQFHRFGHNTTTQILFSCCVCLTDCSEWTEMRFKFLDAVLARVKRWCQPHCFERHATHTAHNTQHILNVISFLFWLEQIDRCIPKSVVFFTFVVISRFCFSFDIFSYFQRILFMYELIFANKSRPTMFAIYIFLYFS